MSVMRESALARLAALAGGSAFALLLGAVALGIAWAPDLNETITRLWGLAWVGFPIVGTIIALKRPRARIGWLLIGVGLAFAVGQIGDLVSRQVFYWGDGSATTVGYVSLLLVNVELVGFLLFGLALMRFPNDEPPSRLWRHVARLIVVAAVLYPVFGALTPNLEYYAGPSTYEPLANPLALPVVADIATILVWAGPIGFYLTVLVILHFIIRGFRSRGVERQQMKWIALPAALFLAIVVPLIVLEAVGVVGDDELGDIVPVALFLICFNAIAVAMGVAVLRYRLYDVERVASRTASYAVLTAILAGVYAAGVVGLGGVVRQVSGGSGGDLVVAASTLAVAALFVPVRRRVQAVVDRRFNRARYDAARTAEAFAQRLRDEVDLDTLTEQLREVTVKTVQPAGVSVWIRED
jgi:hypothetical protein